MPLLVWLNPKAAGIAPPAPPPSGEGFPSVLYDVAFASEPLAISPAWESLSSRARGLSSKRGRSFEFDRMETGTSSCVLDNRDAALNPENTASPYAPVKSTRPTRWRLLWNSITYPVFRGISEGFPQTYISHGGDALVELRASDPFYALNNARFTPGSTTLSTGMAGGVAQNTEETITVASTALPMPQAPPFTVTVAGLTSEWPLEEMTVTEILSATQYAVTRTGEVTYEHPAGAAVTTTAVSFGEEMSGQRIRNVLQAVGFNSSWYDVDNGQSLITASEDLSSTSPLEHINLVVDAEFGRFFASREGLFTFRDRQRLIVDYLTPVFTFTYTRPLGATEVPFVLDAPLDHSDEKLYNRVKITIQGGAYDGQVVDVKDDASISDHFERVFERTFPYANLNDAESAAQYVLARSAEDTLRLPAISVAPRHSPDVLYPLLLAREIGDRIHFDYQPEGGGDVIAKDMVIEGVSHALEPLDHRISFQCTEVDATQYWILGRAGYTELGSTTRIGF